MDAKRRHSCRLSRQVNCRRTSSFWIKKRAARFIPYCSAHSRRSVYIALWKRRTWEQ